MRPLEFPLLADENVAQEVVAALRQRGLDVVTVMEARLAGRSDREVLLHAHADGRVALTHDSDFGTLAIRSGVPYVGIIYLRPGHLAATFILEMLDAVGSHPVNIDPPFLVVAERKGDVVRVRIRSMVGPGPRLA
jgi:predicted nuclease of predicted toxin-antitoxin system